MTQKQFSAWGSSHGEDATDNQQDSRSKVSLVKDGVP